MTTSNHPTQQQNAGHLSAELYALIYESGGDGRPVVIQQTRASGAELIASAVAISAVAAGGSWAVVAAFTALVEVVDTAADLAQQIIPAVVGGGSLISVGPKFVRKGGK